MSNLLKAHSAESLEAAIAAALSALQGSAVQVRISALSWPASIVGEALHIDLQVFKEPAPDDPALPF